MTFRKSIFWGTLTLFAILIPGRFLSSLDGIPLDGKWEAVLLGMALVVLWILYPIFLSTRIARGLVIVLLVWKIISLALLSQGGWYGRFHSEIPPYKDGPEIQRSWDLRAGWHASRPDHSVVIARPYYSLNEFPAWFLNLFEREQRPPQTRLGMDVEGYLVAREQGVLSIQIGEDMRFKGKVDGALFTPREAGTYELLLDPGVYHIDLEAILTGTSWKFVPLWNGKNLWKSAQTMVDPPSTFDLALWKIFRFLTPFLVLSLLLTWAIHFYRAYAIDRSFVLWIIGASTAIALTSWTPYERFFTLILFLSLVFPISKRYQNVKGAFSVLGLPWLTFFVVDNLAKIGRFSFYSIGDDWLYYQRSAHHIFMEGHWLSAGRPTFSLQPLYRWISGSLHFIFGDSSIGELYWDSLFLLIGALFCFHIVKKIAGFRWGLFAAVATLATFTLGPCWHLIGRGLSEISAAGWAYLAGFFILRARLGQISAAVLAGLFVTLMYYTRLNHLLFGISMVGFALPLTISAQSWIKWKLILSRVTFKIPVIFLSCFAFGIFLYALRTWYLTGVFSIVHGTRYPALSTGLGFSTLLSVEVWKTTLESLMMVVTVFDPPQFNVRALAVMSGVLFSFLGLMRTPLLGRLPLGLCVSCLSAVLFSLFVRGSGYPGRFSVHLIPIAVAVTICTTVFIIRHFTSARFKNSRIQKT